jgi:cytochrome c-type biogenesis protein CcmE
MNSMLKFGLITAVIIGSLAWLAMDGISESMTYYVTLEEMANLEDAVSKPIREGGDVQPSSIQRRAKQDELTI